MRGTEFKPDEPEVRDLLEKVVQHMNEAPPVIMPHHLSEPFYAIRDARNQDKSGREEALRLAGWLLRFAWENRNGP